MAQGAITTLQFSGSANFIGSNLTPDMQVGDPYIFNVTYDTAAPNTHFNPGTSGSYVSISASATIQTSGSGPFTVTWENPGIQVEDPGSYQRITFNTEANSAPVYDETFDGYALTSASVSMFTDTASPYDGSLPDSLSVGDFSSNPSSTGMYLYFEPGTTDGFARFSIDTITVIPEPSTIALITGLLAIGGCLGMRRRRY